MNRVHGSPRELRGLLRCRHHLSRVRPHTALVSSPSLTVLHLPNQLTNPERERGQHQTTLTLHPEATEDCLEVSRLDILRPRWVARIGVTRSTEACFLTADRQCTELPLLRLPRLVPEVVGCDPCVPRDLARVRGGLEGARCKEGLCKKPIPVVRPTPSHRTA